MKRQSLGLHNFKPLLAGVVLLFMLAILAACGDGDNTQTSTPAPPTATVPAATPTINPPPTATLAPSPTAEQPVVVIPPATVTPIGNISNNTPAAPIPPAPTGSVVTAPASTPIGSVPTNIPLTDASGTSNTTPQNNPVVTAAPPVTNQATTAPTATQTSGTQTTTSTQTDAGILFYYKDSSLMASVPGEKTPRQVAAKIFGYVQAGPNRVVVLLQNVTTTNPSLDLKLVTFDNGQVQTTIIDTRLFEQLPVSQQNERPGGQYGIDTRAMGEMDISPDGTQIVYTKGNLSGVTFEGMFDAGDKPTELWLANLDLKNPAPKRLISNDKDYMAKPLWSPDGNRITFIRTSLFGTGAGYLTELWSVYKDGSRLAYLTGPKLGKVGDKEVNAAPAYNIRWVGPQILAFQIFNDLTSPIFLHDLSLGRDLPAVIAPDANYNAVYCEGIQRFVYVTSNPDLSPKPGAFSVGITNPANQTSTVAKDATQLFDCNGNSLLYLNTKGDLTIARLTPDGTIASSKSMPVGKDFQHQDTRLSPDGKMVAVAVANKIQVLTDSGQVTEIKGSGIQFDSLQLEWASNKALVALNDHNQLLVVNLDGEKVFKDLDKGDLIDFVPPNEVAKEDY